MATDTNDLRAEAQPVSQDTDGNCITCALQKKEIHLLRAKNIALRDDCTKLRSSLNLVKRSKSELVSVREDAKAKED